MRLGWGVWVAVCLGLGCGVAVESPAPSGTLAALEQEMRVERGSTHQVRSVEGTVFGRTVGVDLGGNAFVALTYERSGVDLGGGALPGYAGLALVKYAPDGSHLWSRGFPTYNGFRPTVSAMAVDAGGHLYLAGEHREPSLCLGGAPVPAGPFLAKYAPDGTHLWSRPVALPGVRLLPPSALAVDELRGHLVVAVNFLDPGRPTGSALLGRVRGSDGEVLAVRPVARSGRLSVTSLALESSGHLAVAGSFEGAVDLGGGPFSTALPRSPFLARFSPDGTHLWSRGLGEAEGVARGVAVEPSRIIVVGEYSGGFLFRGRRQVADGKDAFVAAYSPRGHELWVRHFAESATAVAMDGENRLMVVGQYLPGDSAGGARWPFRAGGSADGHLFLAKLYQGSGKPEWSRGFFSDDVLRAEHLAVTRRGEVVLLSGLGGTADVGTGPVRAPPHSVLLLRLIR